MPKDFSYKTLQNARFINEDLSQARFIASDLRGADFSNANLTGADFTQVKTGITPANTILIFLAALVVSAFSGYIAMLAGRTIQFMLSSPDGKIRTAAILTGVIIV
ncbi:MAG TPA: pentapeptide repeat-containing protein, partial [Flavisolibacter sp.]|nr:pentapeptide repeat-containing protein [Flavisolibacter sp.]